VTTAGRWSEIDVAGHACQVYEPAQLNPHNYTVIYLHGVHLGNLCDHPAFAAEFDRYGLRMIAPVTYRSWWTNKICSEFDAAISAEAFVKDHVVPAIGERWGVRPPRIALLGTSMGGQGALRFAFRFPDTFPIAAAISPAIDYHLRWDEGDETLPLMYADQEAARQDTAILHIHPLYWPRHTWFCCDPADLRWHTSADRLHMKLAALGIPHEHVLDQTGGGHGFEYYSKMAPQAIGFIAERLERERLRVP
jgi:S-formylglutathione hydrolase